VFGKGLRISDALFSGCDQWGITGNVIGGSFDRLVVGGNVDTGNFGSVSLAAPSNLNSNCTAAGVPQASCTGSGTGTGSIGAYGGSRYGNAVRDSIVTSYGFSSSTVAITLNGALENSLIFGAEQHVVNARLFFLNRLKGTFVDLAASGGNAWEGNSVPSSLQNQAEKVEAIDSVLIGNEANTFEAWGDGATAETVPKRVELTRFVNIMGNMGTTGPFTGFVGDAATPVFEIDGMISSQGVPSGTDVFTTTQPESIEDVCFVSGATTRSVAFAGITLNDSLRLFQGNFLLRRDSDGDLRQFVNKGRGLDVCEEAKPVELGLSELGLSHAMLGSFFIDQLSSFSSRDDLTLAPGVVADR
jgi:hypothetical protein